MGPSDGREDAVLGGAEPWRSERIRNQEDVRARTVRAPATGELWLDLPALSRLLTEGLASAETHEQNGKPGKKVYRLTQTGRMAFETTLNADPEPETVRSDFLFMLFLRRACIPTGPTPSFRTGFRNCATQPIGSITPRTRQATQPMREARFVHGYGIAVYRAAADYLEQNAAGFLADLRRQHSHRTEAAE